MTKEVGAANKVLRCLKLSQGGKSSRRYRGDLGDLVMDGMSFAIALPA